jgi:hypothetical protein
VVELGTFDPEGIMTPSIFVDRFVVVPTKKIGAAA